MKTSPLHPLHTRLGARMTSAEGWSLPHTFTSLAEEHLAARSACAVFDISYISKFRVRGNGALDWLESLLSCSIAACADGAGQHALLLDTEGKIIDRLTLLRESAGSFLLLGSAAAAERAFSWLLAHKPHPALQLSDVTDTTCAMALLGPQSEQVLARVLRGAELPAPGRFSAFVYQQQPLILSRLSLQQESLPEHAYEFLCPAVSGISWFESFVGAGAQPCGFATRESLRLERGCPAVGPEITPSSTPDEVRLSHLCAGSKERGSSAPTSGVTLARLRCAADADPAPQPGSAVRDSAGHTVGRITSSSYSPDSDSTLALALLRTPFSQPDMHLLIMVNGHPLPATVM